MTAVAAVVGSSVAPILAASVSHETLRDRYDDARDNVVGWAHVLVEAREKGEPWELVGQRLAAACATEKAAHAAWSASLERLAREGS